MTRIRSHRPTIWSDRLQPIVDRRGFAVGTAQLRIGKLVYLVVLALAFAGFAIGAIATADVVRSIARSS